MSQSHVPEAVALILGDSLTARGVRQWWHARNRYLGGRRPCDAWRYADNDDGHSRVVAAAQAFAEGVYL